jgi:transcriptional regulator with XRE-family HTH domain
MTEKTFAEKLRKARRDKGLTQAELAERAQIPRRTIEGWEGGRMTPPDYVQRLVLKEVTSYKVSGKGATI